MRHLNRDMVKHDLQVTSWELKAYIHNLKFKSTRSNPRVKRADVRVKVHIHVLQVQIHE